MGRPPIGKTAMTGAERVRRYRLKHAAARPVTKQPSAVTKPASPATDATDAALQAENAALREELAQEKRRNDHAKKRRRRRKSGMVYWLEYEHAYKRVSRAVWEAAGERKLQEMQLEILALEAELAKLKARIAAGDKPSPGNMTNLSVT